jgi:hypothetical protein
VWAGSTARSKRLRVLILAWKATSEPLRRRRREWVERRELDRPSSPKEVREEGGSDGATEPPAAVGEEAKDTGGALGRGDKAGEGGEGRGKYPEKGGRDRRRGSKDNS